MNTTALRPLEYKNEFFYIAIQEARGNDSRSYLYNCAVNITRFDPLCWGKGGTCSTRPLRASSCSARIFPLLH